ncbi:uncharacterized protein JCM6883_003975 [Sporobolomyces salmoneus]|uniref:uncharacterized protein n=1 Tax=Sporobolomyces salmoneus TaxID=183962 RepID=UPI00317E5C06
MLWAHAVLKAGHHPDFSNKLAEELHVLLSKGRGSQEIHVEAVIHDCKEADQLNVLRELVNKSESELPSVPSKKPFIYHYKFMLQYHDPDVTHIRTHTFAFNCAISFYDPKKHSSHATQLRIAPLPGENKGAIIATLNPASILVEAFRRLRNRYSSKEFLLQVLATGETDSELDTVFYLSALLQTMKAYRSKYPEVAHGFPFPLQGWPSTSLEFRRVVKDDIEYRNIGKWLLEVKNAVTGRFRRRQIIKDGHFETVRACAEAFIYFSNMLEKEPPKRFLETTSQAQDHLMMPFYPLTPHEPVSRHCCCSEHGHEHDHTH